MAKETTPTKRIVIGPASLKQQMYINAKQDVVIFGGGK